MVSPIANPIINDPVPENIPLIKTIKIGSELEIFLVQLFSIPPANGS